MFYSQKLDYIEATPYRAFQNEPFYKTKLRRQVIHDIKSPLSALNMLSESIDDSKKDLIKKIITRIESIANSLNSFGEPLETPSIPLLMKDLIYEKKLEYQNNDHINLSLEVQSSHIFSSISPELFKRCLSNIINNSYEALPGKGHINIKLSQKDNKISIIISDNGKGISKENLKKVCDYGVSIGKPHGTGLGLAHAKECIESWGGTLKIKSTLHKGTSVFVELPIAQKPLLLFDK